MLASEVVIDVVRNDVKNECNALFGLLFESVCRCYLCARADILIITSDDAPNNDLNLESFSEESHLRRSGHLMVALATSSMTWMSSSVTVTFMVD